MWQYDFNDYRVFCVMFDLKMCRYSSLKEFKKYVESESVK